MEHMHHTQDSCEADSHSKHKKSSWRTAAHATLHCLTGCVIGELIGLVVGVSLGIAAMPMMLLSTMLAYISGFSFTVIPLMRKEAFTFASAFRAIWLGEFLSIGVMEIVMNAIDYHMGGIRSGSITNPLFWEALLAAVPAGYVAAYPVNVWLIGRELKRCH
jgi:hypothetical protein